MAGPFTYMENARVRRARARVRTGEFSLRHALKILIYVKMSNIHLYIFSTQQIFAECLLYIRHSARSRDPV